MPSPRLAAGIACLSTAAMAACVAPWDPADVMIVRAADAPGARRVALLLEHASRGALDNDTYKVVLSAPSDGASAAAAARLADTTRAVLFATSARGVLLGWEADTVLVLRCGGCGITAGDILEKRHRAGRVRVRYEGFP